MLQGFPVDDERIDDVIKDFSESFLQDIAGNMVATPVLLALAAAVHGVQQCFWAESIAIGMVQRHEVYRLEDFSPCVDVCRHSRLLRSRSLCFH